MFGKNILSLVSHQRLTLHYRRFNMQAERSREKAEAEKDAKQAVIRQDKKRIHFPRRKP